MEEGKDLEQQSLGALTSYIAAVSAGSHGLLLRVTTKASLIPKQPAPKMHQAKPRSKHWEGLQMLDVTPSAALVQQKKRSLSSYRSHNLARAPCAPPCHGCYPPPAPHMLHIIQLPTLTEGPAAHSTPDPLTCIKPSRRIPRPLPDAWHPAKSYQLVFESSIAFPAQLCPHRPACSVILPQALLIPVPALFRRSPATWWF
jgi:hypothetical protein